MRILLILIPCPWILGVYTRTVEVSCSKMEMENENGFVCSSLNPKLCTNGFLAAEDDQTPTYRHLHSDLYLLYLLNEASSDPCSSSTEYGYSSMDLDLEMDQTDSPKGKKEMDLIEMICSSQSSQGSNKM
ncbi:hypothetical protein OIU84_025588 [Salix udensis]|uniref:Uncharacterized protein n=1 Tax=Salix udensis TaxID=889485 RepID=A0AAD6KJV6_9ROSI|nr:hypothetical protein OIU84_025588 [Salix udensis]